MSENDVLKLEAEVVVVGAGPAGIAAAVRAAEAGRRVVVLEEGMRAGGQIWRHTTRTSLPTIARRWLERLDRSGARVLTGATALDLTQHGRLGIEIHGKAGLVSAEKIVLCTGARERFLPFPGWTLPNVLGVGGGQALLKSGMEVAGKRVVIGGSGPLLLPVAAAMAHAGATVVTVAEQAPARRVLAFGAGLWRSPARIAQAVRYRAAFPGARYRLGSWVQRADGDDAVREAVLTDGVRSWTERCDLLCVAYGLVPNTRVAEAAGCEVRGGRVVVDAQQRSTRDDVFCAGETVGIGGMEAAVAEGEIAGLGAAGRPADAALLGIRDRHRHFAVRMEAAFALRDELRSLPDADTCVCRCEDVVFGRLRPEWSQREAKLYTRAGMGPCQGRVCGPALQFHFPSPPDSHRTPVQPAAISTLIQTSAPDTQR